jgi:hypothetical protein
MYEVQWHGLGQIKCHGKFNSLKEAQDSVLAWWKQNHFTPPYIRSYGENPVIWDYGSHTCFYYFVKEE